MAAGDPPIPANLDATGAGLDHINDVAPKASANIADVTKKAGLSETTWAGLTVAILGAQDAFTGFSNIDVTSINTMSKQVDSLKKHLDGAGPSANIAKAALQQLLGASDALTGGNLLSKFGKASTDELINLGKQAAETISYHNELASAMSMAMARTGDLTAFNRAAGDELNNLNEITIKHNSLLEQTARSTDFTLPSIKKYSAALLEIPGSFEAIRDGSMNMSAQLELARGLGIDETVMVKGWQEAYQKLSLSVASSMDFTTRASEIAQKYGMRIDDVTKALNNSAGAFAMFTDGGDSAANMTQSLSAVMDGFMSSLKDANVPLSERQELFGKLTDRMSNMSVAQQAFLSSQTGGPGGLMGAFQIDKMKGEAGGVGKIYEMIQKQMKQQLGAPVTLAQAGTSEAAARQYERQLLILQNGPLGSMAKDRASAEKLLEAMQKGTGKLPEITKDIGTLQTAAIERGNKFAQTNVGLLSRSVNALEEMKMKAGGKLLDPLQRTFLARGGSNLGKDEQDAQELERKSMKGSPEDSQYDLFIKDTGTFFKNGMSSLTKSLSGISKTSSDDADQTREQLQNFIKEKREEAAALPDDKRDIAFKQLDIDQGQLERMTAGLEVAKAARGSITNAATPITDAKHLPGTIPSNRPGGPMPVVLAAGSTMMVTFTGNCPHCKSHITTSSQATSIDPTSR